MITWEGETYLTVDEVREKYGKTQGVLYYLRGNKKLNGYRFEGDKHTYWKASELDALGKPSGPPTILEPKKDPALVSLITRSAEPNEEAVLVEAAPSFS